MQLSFIIPTFNETEQLPQLMPQLQKIISLGHEVLIVDGGSTDATVEELQQHGFSVLQSQLGRAKQMNTGAHLATNETLVFLHADTLLPENALGKIQQACQQQVWGRFDVSFSENDIIFKMIAAMMNFRSCISGVVTGDQCVFVDRELFERVEGYPDIPLMEDIALSKRLKNYSMPVCLHDRVITSARRWKQKGVIRTILLMWYLRLAYVLGVSPSRLHRAYYGK